MTNGRGARGVVSPFRRLLLTDVYDGPKAGLAIGADDRIYTFQFLDWDDRHEVRVFSLSLVPGVSWRDVRQAFGPVDPEDLSEWVLPVLLPPQAETVLKTAEATAQKVAVIASADLLKVIDVWRSIGQDTSLPAPGRWLEWLGLRRHGR